MLSTRQRSCWRCEKFFILGSVVNRANALWTSTKPLPNIGADPCNVERCHGKAKRQQRFRTTPQTLHRRDKEVWLEVWEWDERPTLI